MNVMKRKIEYIIKTQIKYLEMKNVISDVNNKLNEISCRLETAEENNSEIEVIIVGIIHNETQKEKNLRKEQSLSEL